MSAVIYLEGGATGPDSKELSARCREGFHKLLEKCGYKGRYPRLIASGSRGETFSDFKTALESKKTADYVAMWIDSEDPMKNIEAAWAHLKVRDNWSRPKEATEDQVLLMTTCMETLIVADREALKEHYLKKLQESALPPLVNLESRHRHEIQGQLMHATRNCANTYAKGKRSFEILAKLSPDTLEANLLSFARTRRILNQKLVKE